MVAEHKARDDMRVEIKIDTDIGESVAIIHTPKITPELTMWIEMLERIDGKSSVLFAKNDNKLFVIDPAQVDIIRTEGSDIKLYNREAKGYIVTKTLGEIHEQLGFNFVRISKSTIVNINRVDHLSPSFNRTMYIVMKNGVSDYISRNYLGDFKKRMGL